MPRILIVDDEPDLVRLLDYNLKQAGYETVTTSTGETALALARARKPDLVLLDIMLPDISGTEVCRQLRRDASLKSVPILMLTAKSEEVDRVVGFELGADDYVTKPFSVRELVLRVKAVLRRGGPADEPTTGNTEVGPVKIDVGAHRAFVEGQEVILTALEFKLLQMLMARLGRVQSREQLLSDVWGITAEIETRTVDTHVKRLREKLGVARDLIETVRGVGYRMKSPTGE
ncbi:MAG: response regulator [Deltaproteobacteria bacterium]|nr:response regulator [Deltaproteobacteria bacterium]